MKRILSIDIDFLFSDCVLYQEYQDEDLTPEQNWEVIKWKYKKPFQFDKGAFLWLCELIQKKCKHVKNIVCIKEHDEIINVFKRWNCEMSECVNVDNHHDITYHDVDSKLNIENWVKFARAENLILPYYWVHQDNSESCIDAPFRYGHSTWKDCIVDDFDEFDGVVICLSQYFTPIEYWGLQDDIFDIVKKVSGLVELDDEDEDNAFLLEEDWYNKQFDVMYTKYLYFSGYVVHLDMMNNGTIWCSMKKDKTTGEYNPFKLIRESCYHTEEILKHGHSMVYGVKIGFKSERIIEMFVRNLCKTHNVETVITNKNKYFIINKRVFE